MTIDIKKTGLTSMIFLIMIAVSLIVIQPVYETTVKRLVSIRTTLLSAVEQNTGLKVSYESMSPSILSSLKLSKIQIIDSQNSKVLAKIASVRFSYNIFNLIRGKLDTALDSLVVTGVSAEFNEQEQQYILEKIKTLVQSMSSPSEFKKLPFSIRITSAALAYKNTDLSIKMQMRETVIKNSASGRSIQFTSNNSLSADFFSPRIAAFGPVYSQFSMQGNLSQNFSESAVQLRIRELKNSQISVKPVEAALWYSNDSVSLQILENQGMFNLLAEYEVSPGDFSVTLEAQNFDPLSLVTVEKPSDIIKSIQGSKISGVYKVQGKISEPSGIHYSAGGSIFLPPSLIPRGLTVTLDAEGDLGFANIALMRFENSYCSIEYSGSFNIAELQPQGVAVVNSILLPNKNKLAAEVYFDPLQEGFLGFIPQLSIGNTSLTALQLEIIPGRKSADFSLVCYDYSHYEYEQNAEILVNGSLFFEDKLFVQTNIEISNLFLDTVLGVLSYVTDKPLSSSLADAQNTFKTFIASTELYISTDFKTITYNTPYTIIANTAKDKELAVLSFDGNESSLQVSQFDVLFAGQNLQASVSADFSQDYSDMFFSADLSVNAIPYELQGVFIDNKNFVLSGSYGFESSIVFNNGSLIAGTLGFNSFPISIQNMILSFSADAAFEFTSLSQWSAEVVRFECTEEGGAFSLSPSLSLAGNFDTYGGMINSLTYADTVSILNGNGNVMWNSVDGLFESAQLYLSLAESVSDESYTVDIAISNPFQKIPGSANFFEDIYCSSQITIEESPLSRFFSQQTSENVLSAQVSILGTLSNPSISMDFSKALLNFQGEKVRVRSIASLDDGMINLSDTSGEFASFTFSSINGGFDLRSFTGNLTGEVSTFLGDKNQIKSSFTAEIIPTSLSGPSKKTGGVLNPVIPDSFVGTLTMPLISSTQYGDIKDFTLTVIRSKGRFDIQGGAGKDRSFTDNPINGYLLDSGECLLILDQKLPLSFVAFGSVAKGLFDIQVNDMVLNAEGFTKIFDLGVFKISQGTASGSFHLGGLLLDPEFTGSVDIENFACDVPDFIEGQITAAKTQLTGQGKYLKAQNISAKTKNGDCFVDVAINFNKWEFDSVVIDLKTPENKKVKAHANLGLIEVSGNAETTLKIKVTLNSLDINGSLYVDDTVARIYPSTLFAKKTETSTMDVSVDLDIMIGKHAQAFLYIRRELNPVIRALVNPMTPLKVIMNTRNQEFYMIGDLVLRGGEVSIGRNFYLREGRLVFDENQVNFDPLITVRAEMRETDQNGDLLRITLLAENQKLGSFSYSLSSSPPKSEDELKIILGQSFIPQGSTSVGDVILNVGGFVLDYLVQNTVLKSIEEGLRDFLKVDILSFKTPVLQNTIKLYSEQSSGKVLTPGNFLDNSTVYIGKYFGDVLYGDFLLHLSYDDSKVDSNNLASGIAFEPELGFEMESPLATIRWSIAPDVGSLHNLWVPYTSISLSWKFMF